MPISQLDYVYMQEVSEYYRSTKTPEEPEIKVPVTVK